MQRTSSAYAFRCSTSVVDWALLDAVCTIIYVHRYLIRPKLRFKLNDLFPHSMLLAHVWNTTVFAHRHARPYLYRAWQQNARTVLTSSAHWWKVSDVLRRTAITTTGTLLEEVIDRASGMRYTFVSKVKEEVNHQFWWKRLPRVPLSLQL